MNPIPERAEPADAPSLLSDAMHRSARLVQNEIELAKREVAHKASRGVGGILMILAALFMVFSAIDVLAAAAVAGLAEMGLPVSLSSLIVAAVAIAIAGALFFAGKSRLDPENLKLERTARNLRKDINTVKENAHV
jgi:hypothetical protein